MKTESRRWWLMLEILAMLAVIAAVVLSGCSSHHLRLVGLTPFPMEGRRLILSSGLPTARLIDVSSSADELWIIARSSDPQAAPDEPTPGSGELMAVVEEKQVPMLLKHTDVKASVSGYIGSVEVIQQFQNPYSSK